MPAVGVAVVCVLPLVATAQGWKPTRMGWVRLLKRVFDIDPEQAPQCGGDLKIIAAIEGLAVMVAILTHLGLPARAPLRAPLRPLALFEAA